MSSTESRTPEERALLVKATDGLLDEQERRHLDQLCAADASLAAELDELVGVRRALARYGLRNANPGQWEQFERQLVPTSARLAGWLLLAAGLASLAGAGLWLFFVDPQVPLWVKLGAGAALVGFGVLFGYVGAGFLRERRADPYKDVVR